MHRRNAITQHPPQMKESAEVLDAKEAEAPGDRNAIIAAALERKENAMRARPYIAQGTATTEVTLDHGLRCTVEEGQWKLTVDMHENYGGDATGPNPGVFARGAFGSCLAMGYAMWAARLDIKLDRIEVDVEADYDARGEFAVSDDVDPGYSEIRYTVRVASGASDEDVMRVIDTSDRYSSLRDVFARAIPIRRTVELNAFDETD